MSNEQRRQERLAEIERQGRQMAEDEILELKRRYQKASDRRYSFEQGEHTVEGVFVSASMESSLHPANAYRIELLVPAKTIVEGQCYVTDRHGQKVGATGA